MGDQSPINLCSIRAQSMQQFNPRPKSAEKGINPSKSWCHFLGDHPNQCRSLEMTQIWYFCSGYHGFISFLKHLKVTSRVLWFTDYGLSMDWAWIDHRLNRLWKHLCVLKIIPYKAKIIKSSICMVPKWVRFNHILPFHRLILLKTILF